MKGSERLVHDVPSPKDVATGTWSSATLSLSLSNPSAAPSAPSSPSGGAVVGRPTPERPTRSAAWYTGTSADAYSAAVTVAADDDDDGGGGVASSSSFASASPCSPASSTSALNSNTRRSTNRFPANSERSVCTLAKRLWAAVTSLTVKLSSRESVPDAARSFDDSSSRVSSRPASLAREYVLVSRAARKLLVVQGCSHGARLSVIKKEGCEE
mmetsp:Transcript_10212/g.32382  ORF Transcript_10212/g.32382 Transcript_10212/m.32382 type:complete len:213 (-) Transcript_10212:46-684(-)